MQYVPSHFEIREHERVINKVSKMKDFSLEIPLITQFDALNQVAASLRYANASSGYEKATELTPIICDF